jgi:hypothetical protein
MTCGHHKKSFVVLLQDSQYASSTLSFSSLNRSKTICPSTFDAILIFINWGKQRNEDGERREKTRKRAYIWGHKRRQANAFVIGSTFEYFVRGIYKNII